jgi:uncharacterized protein YjdB
MVITVSSLRSILSNPARRVFTALLQPACMAILVSCGGGGSDTPVTPPPPPPVLTTINVTLASNSITVGSSTTASASGLDQNGAAIGMGAVTWSSGASSIATVSAAGLVSGVAAGTATIIATVGTKQGQATVTVTPPPVASVVVAPSAPSLPAGGTQQLTATTLDAGGATLSGRVITWTSSDTTKATVSNAGLVTAKAVGTATITATSEGKSGTALVTITAPAPVATVTVAPATATVAAGGTVTLAATARDAAGNVLTGRVFAWSSSSLNVGLNSTQGSGVTVTGVSAGSATVTATSEGKSGASTITVVASAPVVTSVAPATLTPGGSATITGTGFGATIGGNAVTIGSVSATITAASVTQLTATVPCVSSGTVSVVVSSNGIAGTAVTAPLAVTTRTLAVGQSVALLDAPSVQCNELPVTGGRYLISVFSSSTTPSSNTGVTVKGAAAGSAASLARSPMLIARDRATRSRTVMTDAERQQVADARAHFAILEQNRQVYAQLRNAPGLAEAQRAARARRNLKSTVIPLTVGSAVTLKNRGLNGSCNSTTTATGRVVAVTARTVVIEDNASATAGQVDADLVAFGNLFENTMYPIEANFGDINAYDVPGGLDNPGRVVMFFTPSENQPAAGGGQVMGHVSSCDLYPTTVSGAAGSNFTKIFYARTPVTLTGSASTTDSRTWWNAGMPAVLVHEAKHLTANAERFSRNASTLEESWLEEATAQIAVEIYSRSLYTGSGWKTNNTYAATIYCDARVGSAQCPSGQRAMQSPFLYLLDYYKNNETKSILSPGSTDGDIYGSSWMFVRWLVDQYGGGTESTLLRALVQEASLSGVNNVTAKTGQAFATLLADWTLTLIADDYPGFTPAAGAKYTFPSWNTRSIWSGFNTDFGSAYPVFPLITHPVAFGSFSASVTLSGAAAAIFELSGAQATKQLLDLSSLGLSTTIRVSILRVQ